MDPIISHPLIQVTPEEVDIIRKGYGLDETRIKENVDAILDWCQKQEHLREAVSLLTRGNIERLLILAKGSVEATKNKIDKIFTVRGMLPEIVLNKSFDEFRNIHDDILFVMMPKLSTKCNSRIMVTRIRNEKIQNFNLLSYIRYSVMIGEFRLHFEYSMNDRFILDLKNVNINMLTSFSPIILKKSEIIFGAYGSKLKGIHIVNAPPFVDKVVYLLKHCLREKLGNRVNVHNSYEELREEIPIEAIPEDYGGKAPSCLKLAEQWHEYLRTEEAKKIIDISNKLYSDESKRTSIKFNEDYLGMPGSFRKLNVD